MSTWTGLTSLLTFPRAILPRSQGAGTLERSRDPRPADLGSETSRPGFQSQPHLSALRHPSWASLFLSGPRGPHCTTGLCGLGAPGSRRFTTRAHGVAAVAAQLGVPTSPISEASGETCLLSGFAAWKSACSLEGEL